jgi:hypothetical protein
MKPIGNKKGNNAMIYARAMLAYFFPGLLAGFYGGHGGGLSRPVPYWALGAEKNKPQ